MKHKVKKYFTQGYSFINLVNSNFYWLLGVTVLCLFLPVYIFYFFHGSYLVYANESLAYRYFTTHRLIFGELGSIWLPQGFFTLVLQNFILKTQDIFVSPYTSLSASLETFGALTNVVQNLLGLTLFIVVFIDKNMGIFLKNLSLLLIIILLYGTDNRGIYYNLLPDYYQLNMYFVVACLYSFFFIASRSLNHISWYSFAILGFVLGLALANKISLLFLVSAPFVLLLTKCRRFKPIFLVAIFTFIIGFAGPLLLIYIKNEKMILFNYPKWRMFVSAPGEENSFFANMKMIWSAKDNYIFYTISYLMIWALSLISIIKKFSIFSGVFFVYAILLGLLGLNFYISLKTHSAGTTNFEIFSIITTFTFMLFALVPKDGLIYQFKWIFIIFWCCLLTPFSGIKALITDSINSRERAAILWDAHHAFVSKSPHPVMILPDNSYSIAGVEELLLKGFSEFPSWNITTGRTLLNKIVPNLTFRSDYTENKPSSAYHKYSTLMWTDKNDAERLKMKYPELNKILIENSYHCQTWVIGENYTLNVCRA